MVVVVVSFGWLVFVVVSFGWLVFVVVSFGWLVFVVVSFGWLVFVVSFGWLVLGGAWSAHGAVHQVKEHFSAELTDVSRKTISNMPKLMTRL